MQSKHKRMKVTLLAIGKTDDGYLKEGIEKYLQRLKHYTRFDLQIIPDVKNSKNLSESEQRRKEAGLLLKNCFPGDYVVLLDERGKLLRSADFAQFIEQKAVANIQQLTFIIGGPYGFDESVYSRANAQLSLSKMTFSHQMIRLLFVEQLYRAHTILKGEPYHHE